MEELFSGYGWKVVLDAAPLPNGKMKNVARVGRPDTAHVIAREPDGRILLLREFRPYYGTYIWMLPGGRVDKEVDIEEAARRELQEETGYRPARVRHLWTVNHSESLDYSNHFFLAEDLQENPLPQDEDELFEVHRHSVEEALELVHASAKIHLPSAYGLMRYLREKI